MQYNFAIKKCTETLVQLGSDENIEKRVSNAFDEISLLDKNDVSMENLKAVADWCEQYMLVNNLDVKLDGQLQPVSDKNKEIGKLAHQLTYMCIKIIEDTCAKINQS